MPQKLYKWSLKCLCLASKLLSQHYGKKWRTYRLLLFLWDLTLQIINVQKLCLWQNRHLKGLLLTIFRSISRWSAGFTSPNLRIWKSTKRCVISYLSCLLQVMLRITLTWSWQHHTPNIPLKGILAPHCTTLIHLQGLPHEYKQWRP